MNVSDNKMPINKISGIIFSFRDQKKIRKELFFSLLDAKRFQNNATWILRNRWIQFNSRTPFQ